MWPMGPGKGIYFADMFAKSRGYTAAGSGEAAYMLLCDVALGNLGQSENIFARSYAQGAHIFSHKRSSKLRGDFGVLVLEG